MLLSPSSPEISPESPSTRVILLFLAAVASLHLRWLFRNLSRVGTAAGVGTAGTTAADHIYTHR